MRPQIERVFRFVLGLSFLPEKIRAWMFSTGTRAIEVLNAGMLLAWATVMMLDGRVLEMHPYRYFMLFGAQCSRSHRPLRNIKKHRPLRAICSRSHRPLRKNA